MERTYTIETRIRLIEDIKDYLDTYVIDYSNLYRIMWHQVNSPDCMSRFSLNSKYITFFCNTYGVLKRTANTMFKSILGKRRALLELKKYELHTLEHKTGTLVSVVEKYKEKINRLKVKVTENRASAEELYKYQEYKRILYQKQRKLNRFNQRMVHLSNTINDIKFSLCYGGKRFYKAQWYLKENNYANHDSWLRDFRKLRDKGIEYLGSSDETCGNQMCQLTYNLITDDFSLKLRKENKYSDQSKYLYIHNLNFKYLKSELQRICLAHQNKEYPRKPLTFRFKRVKNKWYLQVMFSIDRDVSVTNTNGVIGLDFNKGFIEATEVDVKGNMVHQYHFPLRYHGCGNKAKSDMSETVARIVNTALNKGKAIAVENLSFNKKKAKVGKNKQYNRMLHTLDYSRYTEDLQRACHRKRIALIMVNPAYTSIVGMGKYGKARKLNRHQAASYVIGRLGLGYSDRYKNYSTVL